MMRSEFAMAIAKPTLMEMDSAITMTTALVPWTHVASAMDPVPFMIADVLIFPMETVIVKEAKPTRWAFVEGIVKLMQIRMGFVTLTMTV